MPAIKLHGGLLFLTDESGARQQLEFDSSQFDVAHDSDGLTIALKSTAPVSAGRLAIALAGALVVADGAVTVTGSRHTVDTEAEAAADDLDTIAGGVDGQLLILEPADPARVVTVKAGATIDIGTDFIMDDAASRITLIYDGTAEVWYELARSQGGS